MLDGKVALITGGASGIGAATVRRLRADGATVVFSDLQRELGDLLARETDSDFLSQDVTDESAWTATLAFVERQHGRLDVLVNNAGIIGGQAIDQVELHIWSRVMEVNVTGVMLGCRGGIALMRKNPGGPAGSIVNISSNAGILGAASDAAYSASKGAVRLLTKSIAAHCARAGLRIRCNSVHPGAIRTAIFDSWIAGSDSPETVYQTLGGMCPLGRIGEPEEIASIVAYLASEDAAFATGAEFVVDGGAIAALPSI
jgi:3(or 17)beta-hydroxysteroid dehydrogenase